MTTFLLIRHASHDLLGKAIAGRAPGLRLNDIGRRESERLAARLARANIAEIITSPRERTLDTAQPLASRLNLRPAIDPAIDEIDFGTWTGATFDSLKSDPEWHRWCRQRGSARPPNGEPFIAVQQRIVAAIERLRASPGERTIALFSHGDVIKAALAYYLRISLDHLERFDIAPASVSVLATGDGWEQVKLVNDTSEFAPLSILEKG